MVVDNLDIGGAARCPDEADAPLPVDPHGVLPSPCALHQVTRKPFAILALHGTGSEFSLRTLGHEECVSIHDTPLGHAS
jgi:hypothetical protein